MTRKEFIKACSLLGISIPIYHNVYGMSETLFQPSNKKVVIVGAGAAGIAAAYLLKQQGVDSIILEATDTYGGRMKVDNSFADFPIPLGAEWITSGAIQFEQFVNKPGQAVSISTKGYTQNDVYGIWYQNKLTWSDLGDFTDRKFINNSWLGFFEEYLLPDVASLIKFNCVVNEINYEQDVIQVKTNDGEFQADAIILTVPTSILRANTISFTPALPKWKQKVIANTTVWDGIKVFIEFSEKFYPAFVDAVIIPETDGQLSFYDAAFGQQTNQHILGVFAVGKPAETYGSMSNGELKSNILKTLDQLFEGKATPNYIKHITQDWSKAPYSRGAYVYDHEKVSTIQTLQKSVERKVFFAGDCYTNGYDWGNVHNAIVSAKTAVQEIMH